ncbi:hypothetical protein FOZ61_008743 [Perkinsus olseni]|uniref:Uncharacterized protein n=1 Tax=Perkinsus olseni TaxID=32597 RepID=A0A7J6L3I2_PEROL|nr:hypothetical protein FOL46_009274 [Perkinsus olseni]KAF4653727.1 hypothetical protein FOZ61_008743 [Perkinsus olseni]
MRLTIVLLGCLKWSVDAAARTSSVSGTELTFGETAKADTYSGRKLRRPGSLARPVEKPQTDDDDDDDDDAIGDDDVFMSPEEEENGKKDDDAAFTSKAQIDNFNMRSSWRSKLSELFKYCQKQIVRNNPQVGSIYIRVKTRDEDAVKQAGFELENGLHPDFIPPGSPRGGPGFGYLVGVKAAERQSGRAAAIGKKKKGKKEGESSQYKYVPTKEDRQAASKK